MKYLFSTRLISTSRHLLLVLLTCWTAQAARAQSWTQAERLPAGSPNDNGYATSKATATDAQGNVYIAGNFYGRVSFGATMLVATGTERNADFFVAKVSPSGQWLWAVQSRGTGTDYANDLVLNSQGEVFIAGRVGPSTTLGSITLTSANDFSNDNAFVAKLSVSGQFLWARKAGAATATSLALDAGGSLLVTGNYNYTAAVIGSTTLPTYGNSDVWVAKLDPTGAQWLWAVRAGSTSNDYSNQIGTDAAGNAYLVGEYGTDATFGTLQLPTGNSNGYVAKISPTGQFLYATRLFSGNTLLNSGLVVTAAGDVFVTGGFRGTTLTLGTLRINNNNSSGGYTDGFVARLTPAGSWQWAVSFGGAYDEAGLGLALGAAGELYVTGRLESTTATFGSTVLSGGTGYSSNAFVGRLAPGSGAWQWAVAVGGFNDETGTRLSVAPGGSVAVTGSFSSLNNTFGSTVLSGAVLDIYPNVFVARLDGTNGAWSWALGTHGGGDKRVFGTCADAQGNVYVTGTFLGTVSFGSITLSSTTSGNDIFVAKRSPTGQWLWAARAGGDAADRGLAVAADAQGNVYLGGTFAQGSFPVATPAFSATFGSTTLTTTSRSDLFVAKLDAAGQWLWAVRAGGSGDDAATAIGVDASGAAYITGTYVSSTSLAFGTFTLAGATTQGGTYAAKLSPAGQWQWATAVGTGPGTAVNGRGLAVNAGGDVYITGNFSTTRAFGNTNLTSAGGTDLYLARLNGATGSFVWAARMGGSTTDEGYALALDAQGNPHLTGGLGSRMATVDATPLNNSDRGLLVAKFTPAGQFTWAAVGGLAGMGNIASFGDATALTIDAGGTVYVAGQFQGILTLGGLTLTSTPDANGLANLDLVVARLSPAGVWQQAARSTDGIQGEYATGIVLGAGGQLYVSGYTYSPAVSFGATTLAGYSTYAMGFLAAPGALLASTRSPTAGQPFAAHLYPNPVVAAAPLLRLTTSTSLPELPQLTVCDAVGRVCLRRALPIGTATISLPEALAWPAGTYLLTVRQGPTQQVLRLVRE